MIRISTYLARPKITLGRIVITLRSYQVLQSLNVSINVRGHHAVGLRATCSTKGISWLAAKWSFEVAVSRHQLQDGEACCKIFHLERERENVMTWGCGVGFGNDWALICSSWDGLNECRRRVDERKVGSSQS